MTHLYWLYYHTRLNSKLSIGFYSTRQGLRDARTSLGDAPGFRGGHGEFKVVRVVLPKRTEEVGDVAFVVYSMPDADDLNDEYTPIAAFGTENSADAFARTLQSDSSAHIEVWPQDVNRTNWLEGFVET